jgi:hypothetical protein
VDTAREVELRALMEKLAPEELPDVAAMLLEAWWRTQGESASSVYEFYRRITQYHSGELREQLDYMSTTYRSGQLLTPPPRPPD